MRRLGILTLAGKMADVPGCMACVDTFPYPVLRHVVTGSATPFDQESALAMLPAYVHAARELEDAGVDAITANCGLIAMIQQPLAAAVGVPVVTSALLMVPQVSRIIGGRPVGVLTFFAVDERNFQACGWSSEDFPAVVRGVGKHESWLRFLRDKEIGDADRSEMRDDLARTLAELTDAGVGAIVCECTMIPAVLDELRSELPVPVYDVLTLLDWTMSGFERAPGAGRVFAGLAPAAGRS
jgi:aspartate/glutamate racemase